MIKFALATLFALFVFAAPVEASLHREYYTIDKSFCNGRALLGKASAEARQRGTSRVAWEKQLSTLRTQMPKSSLLYASIPMALLDTEMIYSLKSVKDTTQIYIDLYGDCMGFQGLVIALETYDSPYYARR